MSEEKKELSFCDQLKHQHQMFCAQRDQAQVNLHQLVGAIYACEQMIKKHEEAEQVPSGEQENGEANNEGTQQAA